MTEKATTPEGKGMVLFVMQTVTNDKGEYQACLAIEGERGYRLTDWFFGTDYGEAEAECDRRNLVMGYNKQEATNIVLSTMGPAPTAPGVIGQTIMEVREMTDEEMEFEAWEEDIHGKPLCLVLDNGSILYASADEEGNHPGALFGRKAEGGKLTTGFFLALTK